jgi:ATP-dependent helicase/nuclease subunit B
MRDTAIQLLEKISRHVFFKDVEDNFQHRAWLLRWLEFIPRYIDWQITHTNEWQISAGEECARTDLTGDIILYGRIDRIEKQANAVNLIDYKTGAIPGPDDIASGEDVQLTSYSLLLDHVTSVQYLGVDGRNGVNDKSTVTGEELVLLQKAVRNRLTDLLQRIRNSEPMPAHGDDKTCSYCDATGICRKAVWK